MSDLHPLGIIPDSQEALEAVDPRFLLEGLLAARQKTVEAVELIRASLRAGMTEDEAREQSMGILARLGASKHWHKPYIRFGPGTVLTFHEPLQPDYRLQEGDPFYVDIGPVWCDPKAGLDYEGDYGDTFVLGSNPDAERCAAAARSLFAEARRDWKEGRRRGAEIYALLKRRAAERGYDLLERAAGHRLGDFPHHRHSKEQLAKIAFYPSPSLWVLEVQIVHTASRFGAFFEDLL